MLLHGGALGVVAAAARIEREVARHAGGRHVGERLGDVVGGVGPDAGHVAVGPGEDEVVAEDRVAELVVE
jgi:hypothetical protein